MGMGVAIRWGASIVGTVALLGAIIAFVLRYWPGLQMPIVAAASVSPIVLGVGVVVALACLIPIRAWWRVGTVVLVAIAGIWVQAPYFASADDLSGTPLTVMTSNVMFGQGDVDTLARLVRDERVDVLAVEELSPESADAIAASSIAEDLPHAFVRAAPRAVGTAIYSRYRLSEQTQLPGFMNFHQLSAVAAVPGRGDVQVFALHPVPPQYMAIWGDELERIDEVLHAVPDGQSVIALGDFNATGDHLRFRRLLDHGYRDAGELAGVGWLPTYPTDKRYPPMVGIDHVLVRGLGADHVTSYDVPGTDHRAVIARVG